MSSIDVISSQFNRFSLNNKVDAIDAAFQQYLFNFKELLKEIKHLETESENYKIELLTLKDLCESKNCTGSKSLKTTIEAKDLIIQTAASATIKLDETKNLSIVSDILKILCGDVATMTPKDLQDSTKTENNFLLNIPLNKKGVKQKLCTPKKSMKTSPTSTPGKEKKIILSEKETKENCNNVKKESNTSLDNVSIEDGSVSEIDATPGRTSPIIHSKKLKSSSSSSLSGSSPARDKKKCPNSWSTPEAKQVKLCQPGGRGRLRQGRLSWGVGGVARVVDLTCSPDFAGGVRSSPNPTVQTIIKQESSENEETILPSPTSVPPNLTLSNKPLKDSQKLRKPLSLLKLKMEPVDEACSPVFQLPDKKKETTHHEKMEESINILKPNRFKKSPPKSPKKSPGKLKTSPDKLKPGPLDEDMTHCEDASMSILQHVNRIDDAKLGDFGGDQRSPSKRPLVENKNIANVPPPPHPLQDPALPDCIQNGPAMETLKRKPVDIVEPIYKEPVVRKKAEKQALQGWCCEDCKQFFGHLYGNDPEKIRAVVARSSKHRGRSDPARPRTPPGYWRPRWHVPDDTEEFNRRNNV